MIPLKSEPKTSIKIFELRVFLILKRQKVEL